jgi:hypothetical protein
MRTAGQHVQLGRYSAMHQAPAAFDGLLDEEIERTDNDERWKETKVTEFR